MTINIGRVNEGNLQQEIIDAYKSLRSFAGIALPDPLNTTTSVTLPAANVNGTFSIIHLAKVVEFVGHRLQLTLTEQSHVIRICLLFQ